MELFFNQSEMDNVANDVSNDFSIPFSSVLLTNITEYKTDSAKNITARPEPVWQNFLWRNHVTWPNCTPLQVFKLINPKKNKCKF